MTLVELARSVVRRFISVTKGPTAAARYRGVRIGDDSRVLTHRFGSEPWLVTIGSHTTVSSEVQFLTHDGIGWLYTDDKGRRYRYEPIEVGDHVFVGYGAIIMPGVTIESRSIVGAGSVVTRSVKGGTVVAGNPAREIATYENLMERVRLWPTGEDLRTLDYKARVETVVRAFRGRD